MHLFVRGQNVHALECQGFENISQIKVNIACLLFLDYIMLSCVMTFDKVLSKTISLISMYTIFIFIFNNFSTFEYYIIQLSTGIVQYLPTQLLK